MINIVFWEEARIELLRMCHTVKSSVLPGKSVANFTMKNLNLFNQVAKNFKNSKDSKSILNFSLASVIVSF